MMPYFFLSLREIKIKTESDLRFFFQIGKEEELSMEKYFRSGFGSF